MLIEGVVAITTWVVFWGLVALVIVATHRRISARQRVPAEPHEHAFSESRPTKYIVLAMCVGALVLPFYFYAVHRSARGLLIGFGWLAGIVVGVFGVRYPLLAVVAPGPFVELHGMGKMKMDPPGPFMGGSTFTTFGVNVLDFQDGVVPASSIVWYGEGGRELGRGAQVFASFGPGKHPIRVTVTDSDGNRVERSGTITMIPHDKK